jgi:hypothetical protein
VPRLLCPATAIMESDGETVPRFDDDNEGRHAMNSKTATSKRFFKNVSSLYGFAGADETSALRNAQPRVVALSAISSILSSEPELRTIGWQLAKVARHARLAGRMDVVKDVSETIIGLTLPDEIKTAGRYYQAVAEKHSGNVALARVTLAQIASGPPSAFRCRAILELGKTLFDAGHPIAAMPFYLEAARASREEDFLTTVAAQIMIAIVRSIDGDHRKALADLNRLWPMVHLASYEHPALRYEYLNSLAVELAEAGRIEEAKHVIETALRSPFADRHPNWRETSEEIADKERRISYRPRIFSLAVPSLMGAHTTFSDVPQADTDSDGGVELACDIEARSASSSFPATHSRPDRQSAVYEAVSVAEVIDLVTSPAMGRRPKPSTLASCFIRGGIGSAAIPKPITILQTALALDSRRFLNRASVSGGKLFRTPPAIPVPSGMSESSESACQARGDRPDNIWAHLGYPKSPLARGPPTVGKKSSPETKVYF